MIATLKTNPYTSSQQYFDSLTNEEKTEFLAFLFTILTHKTIIFSKFIHAHPYFEEYIFSTNLESYNLTYLENNRNIIHAVMQIEQKFLPNIIFCHQKNNQTLLGIILQEPFSRTSQSSITKQIVSHYNNTPLQFYICKQSFLYELTLALSLQQHFHRDDLREELVNDLLQFAIQFYASDIHLVSQNKQGKCFLRIDGVLVHFLTCSITLFTKISQKLKLLCELDINETRFPQDGHFKTHKLQQSNKDSYANYYTNNNLRETMSIAHDIRISFFPTLAGESIVLRIPHCSHQFSSLDSMQIDTTILESLKTNLLAKHGLILISGPTGSGKSTLLYNCLRFLNDGTKKIITIEDPVEQEIMGITQCQINEDINLSFATALKYILRQDPDIIMVGEIRDFDTLAITLRAALTGHLVLASLHSSDCISSLARLKDLGAKEYLLDSVLKCIIAQRLLKTLCPHCKQEINGKMQATGCQICYHQGYGRRILIQEILDLTKKTDSMPHNNDKPISQSLSISENNKNFYHSISLKQQAYSLWQQGIIGYEESLV